MNDSPQDFSEDPRLAAYALGELEGAERAEVEALVRSSPAAAAAVEEIRRLAGALSDALRDEAIEAGPAAEMVPIEASRLPLLRRVYPWIYVASGLAAGWATALLLFRPAPTVPTGSGTYTRGVAIPMEKTLHESIAVPAVHPFVTTTGAQPAASRLAPVASFPRPEPIMPQPVVDVDQLRKDLMNFELVQPALGAGKRIAATSRADSDKAVATAVVQLAPFAVESGSKDSFSARTLAGSRVGATTFGLGAPVAAAAGDPLASPEARLRSLLMIDGTQPGQAASRGWFCQLYPTFLGQGGRARFDAMMADSNPVVAAMGALCTMAQYPNLRPEVLARMGSDPRPVTYVRAGSVPQYATLGALFHSIAADPNFLFPLGSAPSRP